MTYFTDEDRTSVILYLSLIGYSERISVLSLGRPLYLYARFLSITHIDQTWRT